DADGNFAFDKVPSGDRVLYLQYRLNDRETSRVSNSHGEPIVVKPGATQTVTLGGTGRTVTGRVALKGAEPDEIDSKPDAQVLSSNVPQPNIEPPNYANGLLGHLMSDEARQKVWEEYYARQRAYWQTDKGLAPLRTHKSFTLLFDTNGTFHID